MEAPIFFFGALVVLCLWIALVDIRELRIPNWLNTVLGLVGLAYLAIAADHWRQAIMPLAFAVAIALACGAFRWLHFRRSGRIGLGLGDVKMIGVAAIWIAPSQFPLFLFVASACALVFALANAVFAGTLSREKRIPFGPFLALGLVMVWPIQENLW